MIIVSIIISQCIISKERQVLSGSVHFDNFDDLTFAERTDFLIVEATPAASNVLAGENH
jgi:hypothetical protein